MPSTGYVNGTDFGIYIGGTLISVATENSMQLSANMIAVSSKDSGDDAEYIPGRGDGTFSGSSRVKYDAGYGFTDLLTAMINKTLLTLAYSNKVTGDIEYTCNAYISELSRTDPDDDNSTIEYTFQKTGAITQAAVSA